MNIFCIGNGTLSVAHQELVIAAALKEAGHEVRITHDLRWGFFNLGMIPEPLEEKDIVKQNHGDYNPVMPDFGGGKVDVVFGMDQSVSPFVDTMKKQLGCPGINMFLDFPKHVVDEGSAPDFNPEYSKRFYQWLGIANEAEGLIFNNTVAVDYAKRFLSRDIELVWYPLCNLSLINKTKAQPSDPYVASCHRFISYKGTEYLIKALYGIPIDYKAISVSGNLLHQVKAFGEDMLEERFHHIVKAPEKEKLALIANAEVLVYPQITDWVGGLSPLEAMALRTPAICFDYPVLRELYADCAIYAEKEDVDSLQERILQVLNGEFDESIIDRAFGRVAKYFTPNKMAEDLTKVFERYI